MNKTTYEAKAGLDSKKWGMLALQSRIAAGLVLLAAGFALGVVVATRYIVDPPRPPEAGERQAGTEPRDDGAEALLTQVNLRLRELFAQHERLEAAAKQDRIAYNLLRSRDYPDDSVECIRLVNRQKQLSAAIGRTGEMIAEAERLQQQLHHVIDAAAAPGVQPGLPPELIVEIRRCVSRMRSDSSESPIPDERWTGGPDLLMHIDQQQDP